MAKLNIHRKISSAFEGRREFDLSEYYNFEAFVLALLSTHVRQQGKEFFVDDRSTKQGIGVGADGFAPDGFDNFREPVFVECLLVLSKNRLLDRLRRYEGAWHHYRLANPGAERAVLLIVTDRPYDPEMFGLVKSNNPVSGLDVVIWGKQELDGLANRYPAVAREVLENLLKFRVDAALKTSDADWKGEQALRIAKLAERFSSGHFALFLGAGVSSSAGMPDWNSLLNALFVTYLTNGSGGVSEERILELVKRMQSLDAPSALVSARYLRKGIAGNSDDGGAFRVAIRRALYGLRKKDRRVDSALIQVLVELCMPRRSGTPVKSVVTYNFDDLFERQLTKKSILHKCIFSENAIVDVDELPVYHVHGFIPEKAEAYQRVDDATLVFAEEGYHQIYTDAYHWSNLVQLSVLRDSTCLMVGLSMADPNLRRLLEIAKRGDESSRHFAFMKRTSLDGFMHDRDSDGKQRVIVHDPLVAGQFLERHHALTEVLMQELGVTVIWYENHDDIPTILREVGFPGRGGIAAE